MKPPAAYKNGKFLPAAELSISMSDAGSQWGAVITDRLRTFDGRLFRVEDHLRRFRESCRLARVPLAIPDATLAEVSHRLVKHNYDRHDLSLVWLATPGEVAEAASRVPTIIAYTQPIVSVANKRLFQEGATLVTCSASMGIRPQIKHRSRLAWWIARRDVREIDRHAEPLFIDLATDHLLETPTANLIVVVGGMLVSPPAGSVLEGVSLKVVEELCERHHVAFQRRHVQKAELNAATEVLLANTTYCLAGVSRIDRIALPFPGPMLGRLRKAWSELVGMDIDREFRDES
jgi:branched-subunit amino acid aminotransferase/4-amino-4-deoxychorismate lyase